jgi:hypothetical protein
MERKTMLFSKHKYLFFILLTASVFHMPMDLYAQQETGLYNVRILFPGMTETITVEQRGIFPLGCPRLFILVAGKGSLGISLLKNDRAGDGIFITGIAFSSAGTEPIFRVGASRGMLDQIVEIGDSEQPYGLVWLYFGVFHSEFDPAYTFDLRLSLAP